MCWLNVRAQAAAAAVVWCTTACGAPSTAPSQGPFLNIKEGANYIGLTGFGISSDPLYPPCSPPTLPRDGTAAVGRILIERSGNEWRGRADSPADRDVDMRIVATGESTLTGTAISGSLRGLFHHSDFAGIVRDVAVEVSQGTFTGEVDRGAFLASGRLAGRIVFRDSAGNASECTAVKFLIQPTSGILTPAPPGAR